MEEAKIKVEEEELDREAAVEADFSLLERDLELEPSSSPRRSEIKRNHDWDKYPCLICNRPYKTVAYLQKHMMAKHKICDHVVQIRCEFCGIMFSDQEQFRVHAARSRHALETLTGEVAQLRQEQLEYSRVVRKRARIDAQEENARKKEVSHQIFQKVYDCPPLGSG